MGGVWDRRLRCYVANQDAKHSKQLLVHDGQLAAFEWFASWLRAYVGGEDPTPGDSARVWSALFGGGRRGGKTRLGVTALALISVAAPGSLCWIVSESISKSWEVHAVVQAVLPPQWYVSRGAPWFEYTLINGSMLWQKSAHDPDDIKQGGVSAVLLNEGQKLDQRAFINARGATADTGGLVVVAANPPQSAKGQWVLDFHDEVRAGRRKARYFHFDSTKNPFIVHESLTDLADEVDDRTYAMEVEGEFLPRSDVVFYNWSRLENEQPLPELGDITEAFLRKHVGRAYDAVLGVDFQAHPFMAAVSARFFRDPEEPEGQPLIWYDEAIVVDGTERDLCEALRAADYDPETTLIVADASGQWQDGEHSRGKGSFELMREAGFRHVVPPDTRMKKNPEITERIKVALAMIKAKTGKRRLFSAPENLELNRDIRQWENRQGIPYRRSQHAHRCDAATYILWRFFPRRKTSAKVRYANLQRLTRRDEMKGF